MEIRLEKHIGQKVHPNTGNIQNIEFNHWQIFTTRKDGRPHRLGYIGKEAGAPLRLIDTLLTEDDRQYIHKAVGVLLKSPPGKIFYPPPPEPELEEDDGDEDDVTEDEEEEEE